MSTTPAARICRAWRCQSQTIDSPRGLIHASRDGDVALCGRTIPDGWWLDWSGTQAVTCAKCAKEMPIERLSYNDALLALGLYVYAASAFIRCDHPNEAFREQVNERLTGLVDAVDSVAFGGDEDGRHD